MCRKIAGSYIQLSKADDMKFLSALANTMLLADPTNSIRRPQLGSRPIGIFRVGYAMVLEWQWMQNILKTVRFFYVEAGDVDAVVSLG